MAVLLSDEAPGSQDQAFAAAIAARFDRVNDSGGIFGRRLDMQAHGNTNPTADIIARSFAMLGPLSGEAPAGFAVASIPRIAPFSSLGTSVALPGDQTFLLFPGLVEHARILVDVAARTATQGSCRPAIVLSEADRRPSIVTAIDRSEDIDTVFYFGPRDGLAVFAEAAARQGWFPLLLLSGLHTGRSVFALADRLGHRVVAAAPVMPSLAGPPTSGPGTAGRQGSSGREQHPVAWALGEAVASVLIEGLRRAGHRVDRAAFVAALEGLAEFDTGLSPRIGFGPNRRLGAPGTYVLEFAGDTGALPSRVFWVQAE